ncbi:MAG TPA: hypothetical protein VFU21_23975 [Kofleriaceae bacterium]|nr:hypothetical protein [Kofleriaceae bacterium]
MQRSASSPAWLLGLALVACRSPSTSEVDRPLAISPELEVDLPLAQPGGTETAIDAASSDGTSFLLVWRELDERLWAARFGLDGERLQPVAHALGVTASADAEVAFHGSGHVLAWTAGGRVHAALLDSAGQMIGAPVTVAEPIAADGDLSLLGPALAIAGDRVLVAWTVSRSSNPDPIRGRILDLSLAPVAPAFDISPLATGGTPVAASDGTNFFVAWQAERIRGARVTAGGVVVDGDGIAISPSTHLVFGPPRIAFGGGQYLVIWRRGANAQVYGRRYTPSGISLDAAPYEFTAGPNDSPAAPGQQAVFDGDRFVVSWIDDRDGARRVYASRLATDGTLEPTGGARVDDAAAQTPTASASAGGVTLLARRTSFALTDADGTTLTGDPLRFAWRYNQQAAPALCPTPSGLIAVWRDDRRVGPGIHAVPLASDGTPQAAARRLSSTLADPVVACGDGVHLVAWRDDADLAVDVMAVRVDDDAVPLDGSLLDLGDSSDGPPAVASTGGAFLVVWSNGSDIYGRRVSGGGALPDPGPVPISTAAGPQTQPGVAFGDGVYLAAWADNRDGLAAVWGARVDPDGTVLDLTGVRLGDAFAGDDAPVLAHGAAGFLVEWQSSFRQLSARLVGSDGAPAGPEQVVLENEGSFGRIDAAWDGSSFALVAAIDALDTTLLLTRLDETGGTLSLAGEPVAAGDAEPVTSPVVSAMGAGGWLVGYERNALYGGRATRRVRLIAVTLDPAGTACASSVLCASGNCVDGVCCDEECGGGDPLDCRACSVAQGGAADGTCGPVAVGSVCRQAIGDCDVEEVCDGSTLACPADQRAEDGAECSDGDACTSGDSCAAGECAGGGPVDCSTDDPCQVGSCQATTGECLFDPVTDGTPCPPPDPCAVSAACVDGECRAGAPIECPAAPACQVSDGCNTSTGQCETSPAADGTPCEGGVCQGGACTASAPDAGPADAGVAEVADAGSSDEGDSSGCGCGASRGGGGASAFLCLALALAAALRARRRRL